MSKSITKKAFVFLVIIIVASLVVSSAGDSDIKKTPTIVSRTATTDTFDNGDGTFTQTNYMGIVNINYSGEIIPVEEYLNPIVSNGKLTFNDPKGNEIVSFDMNYEKENVLSVSSPKIEVNSFRGGYYFETDADTEVKSMEYDLSSEFVDEFEFVNDKLKIHNFYVDFGMAKEEQNITTTFDDKTNKLIFEIEDGKTGSLERIDPDIGLASPTATGDDYNQWINPTYAYTSNNQYAYHGGPNYLQDYYNFGFSIPDGSTIDGILIRVEAKAPYGPADTDIELSYNGGSTYTSTGYSQTFTSTSDATKEYGGSSDEWGRTWDVSEFSNTNFRLRIKGGASYPTYLDNLQTNIYYTQPSNPSLNLTYPTSSNSLSTSGDSVETLYFNVTDGSGSLITSGVTYGNVTIGGLLAYLSNHSVCTGTLDCSAYSTETSCNNCSQCNWSDSGEGVYFFDTFENGDNWTESGNCASYWGYGTSTPTGGTGPQDGDSNDPGSNFVFMETSSGYCDGSPNSGYLVFNYGIDWDAGTNDKIRFMTNFYGTDADIGVLTVEENSTGEWVDMGFSEEDADGNDGLVWTQQEIDASTLTGTGTIRFYYSGCASYEGDIGIDKLNISSVGGPTCSNIGSCSSCDLDECSTNCSTGGCSISILDDFGLADDGHNWTANVTVPSSCSGSSDLWIDMIYDGKHVNSTETEALQCGFLVDTTILSPASDNIFLVSPEETVSIRYNVTNCTEMTDGVTVDYIKLGDTEVSVLNTNHIENVGWESNVTAPHLSAGFYNLDINVTYNGESADAEEVDAINYRSPRYDIVWNTPTEDYNHSNGSITTYKIDVTCRDNDCYNSSVILDPEEVLSEAGDENNRESVSRTATTDTFDNRDDTVTTHYYAGAVNINYNGEFIPMEEYLNPIVSNGKLTFNDPKGNEIVSFDMNYEKENILSLASPKIEVNSFRGGYYFETDADTEVKSMEYYLSSEVNDIEFSNDKLILGDIQVDFGMAKREQNITTTFDDKTNKLIFEIEDGKTGSLKVIDPTVTATYNFSDQTNIWAFEETGFSDSPPPASGPHPSTDSSITTDSSLDASDNNYASFTPVNYQSYHLFVADVQENVDSISLLNWTWEGHDNDAPGSSVTFYIWNATASVWYTCAGGGDSSSDYWRYCYNTQTSYTFDLEDMINASGSTHFLVYFNANLVDDFYTDFAKLEITYTPGTNALNMTYPTTEHPESGLSLDIVQVWFNVTDPYGDLITSDVTWGNASVCSEYSSVSNHSVCTGTLDCSAYSTETSCNNCSQCSWSSIAPGSYDYEDYESSFGDYDDSPGAGCSWYRGTSTPSGSTGPQDGGVGGAGTYFAYIEASDGYCYSEDDTAYLLYEGEVNWDSNSTEEITFYYNMYGAHIGTLSLEENSTGDWGTLYSRSGDDGNSGNSWTKVVLDVSNLTGNGTIRFKNVAAGSYYGDTAIDRVNISVKGGTGCSNDGLCSSCDLDECSTNCSTGGCSIDVLDDFGISADGHNWTANITIPKTASGSCDLLIDVVYDDNHINSTETAAINVDGLKYGAISTVVGDTPFYTTSNNPQYCNLSVDESCTISWDVNATGRINTVHTFYGIVENIANSTITNESSHISVTIDIVSAGGSETLVGVTNVVSFLNYLFNNDDYTRNSIFNIIADTVMDRISNFLRLFYDNSTLSGVIDRLGNFARLVSQLIDYDSVARRVTSIFSLIVQSINIEDGVDRTRFVFRYTSQLVDYSDSILRNIFFNRIAKEDLVYDDNIVLIKDLFRHNFQQVSYEDLVYKILEATRFSNQVIFYFDSIDRLLNLLRYPSVLIDYGDSVNRFYTIIRLVSDAIDYSDVVNRFMDFIRSPYDHFSINQVTTRLTEMFRNVSEDLNIGDAVNRFFNIVRNVFDRIKAMFSIIGDYLAGEGVTEGTSAAGAGSHKLECGASSDCDYGYYCDDEVCVPVVCENNLTLSSDGHSCVLVGAEAKLLRKDSILMYLAIFSVLIFLVLLILFIVKRRKKEEKKKSKFPSIVAMIFLLFISGVYAGVTGSACNSSLDCPRGYRCTDDSCEIVKCFENEQLADNGHECVDLDDEYVNKDDAMKIVAYVVIVIFFCLLFGYMLLKNK